MKIIHTKSELQKTIAALRADNYRIGFVPTMGALHDGHISLVKEAKKHADKIVVSIFVNPTQFAPHEDFDKYPRQVEADKAKLESCYTDILYLPERNEIYPKDFNRKISVGSIGKELEGVTRPHFFDGVALVVTELFDHVKPDIAVFGEKDFQQLHVIRQLGSAVKIIGAPIIREKDGLAMSSRNAYLSTSERKIAANLYAVLNEIKEQIKAGINFSEAIEQGKEKLLQNGFDKVDYIELRDAVSLAAIREIKHPARLLAAVFLGKTRLIDNIEILP